MRTFGWIPKFWRHAIVHMIAAPVVVVPIAWLMFGPIEGTLIGIPVGILSGFVVHLNIWRTFKEHE